MMKISNYLYFILATLFLSFSVACDNGNSENEDDDSDTTAMNDDAETPGETDGTTYFMVTPDGSEIMWMGYKPKGQHYGNLEISSGHLTMEEGEITGGQVKIDMASLSSTDELSEEDRTKLMNDLKGDRFFHIEEYPHITFQLTSVEPFSGDDAGVNVEDANLEPLQSFMVSNPTHTVNGELTIREETRSVSFPAVINIKGNAIEAKALFPVDRKEWNLRYKGDAEKVIQDNMFLGFQINAPKQTM